MFIWNDIMQSVNYHLSSLEIENFRQYRNAKINFSRDPQKFFTILRGANGAGKTNIMNAITWCLYGTEKHLDSDDRDLPIINTRVLKEKPSGYINMRVKLILSDNSGDRVQIERKLSLLNGGTNTIYDKKLGILIPDKATPNEIKTFQWYDPRKGWESTNYFDKNVKELLPEDLATYFLFDGEKLEDFFDQTDDTKKGIEDVSQIKITETVLKNLQKIVSEKRRTAKNLDPQVEALKQQMIEYEEARNNVKQEIIRINTDLSKKQSRLTDIEKSLEKKGGQVGQYQEQALQIKKLIRELEDRKDDVDEDIRSYVLKHMSCILMLSPINNTLSNISQKSEEGILPPKIKDTFLHEILNKEICICGNNISKGTKSRDKVMHLLEKAAYSGISNLCTELRYELKSIPSIDTIKSDLMNKESNRMQCRDDIKKRKDEYEDIEAKIGNVDDDLIKRKQSDKRKLDAEIAELNKNLGSKTEKLNGLQNQYDRAEREYERELLKDDKQKNLNHQLEFCKKSLTVLQKVKDELLEDVRMQVQKYTKAYFLEFLWKKNTYDDVNIDKDYRITAHHVDGYNVRNALSKGEKLVLALSFMSALRKITGFKFPLVIDTPLGRVSGEPRYNIASTLPDFLKDTQVTLLVTDTEYQAEIQDDRNNQKYPAFRDTLSKNVGKDYDIVFVDSESKVMQK